ncbi:hypothetical protein [Kitasatospora sp. NPDC001527]|uniref:hypothetical protein n=1 Tax=Kitasatospora sp. NPDC001527 TaxID=3154519 RepID=UPI00331E34C4
MTVTNSAWLRSDHLVPGKEVFRSERRFHLLAYTASHSQLLLRSVAGPDEPGEPETTIDVLFKPVGAVRIRTGYRGLAVRYATAAESRRVRADHSAADLDEDDRVFVLESQGECDYVVAMAFGWREGVLERTFQSLFVDVRPDRPIWPTAPLDGVDAGLTLAPARELLGALAAGQDALVRRERHRRVHVVMTRVLRHDGPHVSGAGVFLTAADAEQARAVIAAKDIECWIEELPIAV